MSSQVLLKTRRMQAYIVVALCAFVGMLLLVRTTPAQQRPERKAANLQVLDSTISHDELIDIMGKFSSALGVDCDYCHVPSKAPGSREMDFASDEKPEKKVARAMFQMTSAINASYLAKITELESPRVPVECVTCHRGQPLPIQLEDLLSKTLAEHGMPAVDSTYRDLRENYYGSGSFDFGERVLVHLAYNLFEQNSKDAMSLLKLNEEFNPKSSLNQWAMGKLYLSTGDTLKAVVEYKRALEYDPNNRRAKRELDALGIKP